MASVVVEYDEFSKLKADETKLNDVISLYKAEFADETCRTTAIKAVLGIKDEEEAEDTDTSETE